MGSARANQSPILYRISKVISRTHCHDLPFQESHNAVSIHQTTDRKRSCKYVYDYMSSILHQRCWVELATYFTPAQKHVGGLWHHTLGMIIQFHIVSVGYPVLTRLWVTCSPTKAQKTNYWTTCNQPVQKEIQGTPRFPNICRNVGSLAVMASVPRGKTNRWSLDDLKTDLKPWWFWCFPKDIQGLGPLPLCLHSLSIHVSFYIHVSELTVQVDFYRFLLGFGSRSKKEQDPFYFFPADQGLYLSDGYCNLKKWQINILKSGLCWPSCRSFANKSCRIQTDLRISTDFADKAPGLGKAVDIWR